MRRVTGCIRHVFFDSRLIEMKIEGKLEYFYLARSKMKQFQSYLRKGLFISLICESDKKIRCQLKCFDVVEIVKVSEIKLRRRVTYFDKNAIRRGVSQVLNRPGNKMFLDLEFTMPSFNYSKATSEEPFISEVVQFGYVLENNDGEVISSDSFLIAPRDWSALNSRTLIFINRKRSEFKKALSFQSFHKIFSELLNEYQPMIYVWGKNDISVLDQGYLLHEVDNLTPRSSFVNLLQLIKNYFGLRSDVGLFNCFRLFEKESDLPQTHDALDDAFATSMIFHHFRKFASEDNETWDDPEIIENRIKNKEKK